MSDFLSDPLTRGLRNVLDLRMEQHALTATNLANANTPGYKAKVIDFSTLLDRAVHPEREGALLKTDPLHLDAGGGTVSAPHIEELETDARSIDGNSVVGERETMRLNENAVMYQAVARGVGKHLALLRFAATDGKV